MQEDIISKPAKLLVVDDQDNTRILLKRRLAMYGHEIFEASTTKEALTCLSKNNIDVILLNMFLGKENTYDFLISLKNNEKLQNIPVIMISKETDVELLTQCIQAGAEDYLVRPLNQTFLKARLSNCIARREAFKKEISYLATIEEGQKQIKEQEHMATIGEIVSSIAQELKNPLNFVINFAQISADVCEELQQKISTEPSKRDEAFWNDITLIIKKFHDNISKVSNYGRDIDQIIKFMLEQTRTDDTKYLSNMNKIITQTISLLKASYKSKNIGNMPEIKLNMDSDIRHIKVSVQLFSKVIRNILDNAVYAVMKKFEDISQAKIEINIESLANDILIKIYDNGIGIKEEDQSKIFEPFFSDKPENKNPGLGLSNCVEIIKEMHGNISLNSKEGQFTEFTITIPKTE